jgi:membrane protein DedA with SNARE-associated domain
MPSPPWGAPDLIQEIINGLLGLPPTAVYGVIGILAAVENVFPPVPADTAVAIGAFLSIGGPISANAVFFTTWISNVTAAFVVYLAGRIIGRPFFRGRLGRRLLRPAAMARLERLYHRYGMLGIFASRFVPGIRGVVPAFAGVANLGSLRVGIPLVIASGVWYGALTVVAVTLVREIDQITGFVGHLNAVGVAVGVLLVLAVGAIWWRRRRARLATRGDTGEV